MLIGCLFDAYYMMIWWWLCLFELFDQICKNMQSEWLTQFCICLAMLPQNTGGQACVSSEGNLCDSLFCLIHHCKSSPHAFLYRRWPQWESYEREDANSPLQFLQLEFKNRSVCMLWVWHALRLTRLGNLSKCNVSVWASWFPLVTVTAVEMHCYGRICSKLKSKRRNQWF